MRTWNNLRLSMLGLAIGALCGGALADELNLRMSGFGTAGIVRTNSSVSEFAEVGQPRGASRRRSFSPDSKIAAQLDGWVNDRVSGTVQVMSRYNGNGNEHPTLERAFAKVGLGGDWSVRAGRIGAQYFAVSDFRDVGYANTWLRAPTDVYGQFTLRKVDGVSAGYNSVWNAVPVTLQLYAGQTSEPFARRKVSFDNQLGLSASADVLDGVALRFGYVQGKLTSSDPDVDFLLGALRANPAYVGLANDIDCRKKKTAFTAFGVSVDRDNWVAAAEYTMGNNDCFAPDTRAHYVMLGYRFGDFTPYGIASKLTRRSANFQNTVVPGPLPTDLALSLYTQALQDNANPSQSTQALGVRWDAVRNLAIKMQWERIDTHGGPGLFHNVQPFVYSTRPVQVWSAAVDFVF